MPKEIEEEDEDEDEELTLRMPPDQKAMLRRAAALRHTNLEEFVLQSAADVAIENAKRVKLSARDTVRVLELLENPPAPNKRLLAAIKSLPSSS